MWSVHALKILYLYHHHSIFPSFSFIVNFFSISVGDSSLVVPQLRYICISYLVVLYKGNPARVQSQGKVCEIFLKTWFNFTAFSMRTLTLKLFTLFKMLWKLSCANFIELLSRRWTVRSFLILCIGGGRVTAIVGVLLSQTSSRSITCCHPPYFLDDTWPPPM